MYSSNTLSLYDRSGNRKYLNQEERLAFEKHSSKQEESAKLFCLILLWSGMRISEALSLKYYNFDFEGGKVIVESLKKRKKGLYRSIPLSSNLMNNIRRYGKDMENQELLWTWSRRTASRFISRIMIEAGIVGIQACPKGIRHSFAVHCATCNIPITLIKKWMGHSSLSVTIIYLDIVGTEERKFAERIWNM